MLWQYKHRLAKYGENGDRGVSNVLDISKEQTVRIGLSWQNDIGLPYQWKGENKALKRKFRTCSWALNVREMGRISSVVEF